MKLEGRWNPGIEVSILLSNSNISGGVRSIEVKGKGECVKGCRQGVWRGGRYITVYREEGNTLTHYTYLTLKLSSCLVEFLCDKVHIMPNMTTHNFRIPHYTLATCSCEWRRESVWGKSEGWKEGEEWRRVCEGSLVGRGGWVRDPVERECERGRESVRGGGKVWGEEGEFVSEGGNAWGRKWKWSHTQVLSVNLLENKVACHVLYHLTTSFIHVCRHLKESRYLGSPGLYGVEAKPPEVLHGNLCQRPVCEDTTVARN